MAQWKESRLWDAWTRIRILTLGKLLSLSESNFLIYEVMKWKITKSMVLNPAQNETSSSGKRVLTASFVPGAPEPGAGDTGDRGNKMDKPASVDWLADTV